MKQQINYLILLPFVFSCGASIPHTGSSIPPSAEEAPIEINKKGTPLEPNPLPVDQGLEPYRSTTLVGGVACLIRLQQEGISFKSLTPLRGVETPVKITGPVGGILYEGSGKHPLICDCRLALALARAGSFLSQLGINAVYFSGAYSYRMQADGKLSRHAEGLAIDIHRVRMGEQWLKVEEDFSLGLEEGCQGSHPVLNRMACLLKGWGVFDQVLTPDFDRAHYNHFHLAIYSLHQRRFVPKDTPPRAIED